MMRTLLAMVALAGCGDDYCGPIADACAYQPQGCPLTWTAAQDPTSWNCNGGGMFYLHECSEGYHLAERQVIDTGTNFYYDPQGSLYMIEDRGIGFRRCEGGTSEPHPRCDGPSVLIHPAGPGCPP